METYGVQKTQLVIHTEDRDITKWATPTQFEIDLPVSYKTVVGLRLSDIELPTPLYVFAPEYQNTKLTVLVDFLEYVVEITPGYYETPEQLANELTGKLNAAAGVTSFTVLYDKVAQKLVFTNSSIFFRLYFDVAESYAGCASTYFLNHTNWGLGGYLGFEKAKYSSSVQTVKFDWAPQTTAGVHTIRAPNPLNLKGDANLYLELATYNSIDEMQPYQERSSDTTKPKHGGSHNASFARIPVLERSSTETYLSNIYFRDPPLERVQKLRFLFRFHDGRPVQFHGRNFSFSLEVTTLRNEMAKPFSVNRNNYTLS